MEIRDTFRNYLEEALGPEKAQVAFSAFSQAASTSVRINPHKVPATEIFPEAVPVIWSKTGKILKERPLFTLDPLFHSGAYYVQDSSSMFVGKVFRTILESEYQGRDFGSEPLKVLDLCAAPGGKTTDLASSLRDFCGSGFLLVANEVMKQRVQILADNVAIWGDPNVVVTNSDPADFSGLSDWFDIILTDVPCSGEGMFRKDVEAQRQWSEDNVALCASRQRRILADVWPSLADGGTLIYSTCTFNRHENDDNVSWLSQQMGADPVFESEDRGLLYDGVIRTGLGFSLVPGFVPGEGQYCSAVRKNQGEFSHRPAQYRPAQYRPAQSHQKAARKGGKDIPMVAMPAFTEPAVCKMKGELIIAVPENINSLVCFLEDSLRVVQSGCAVGTVKGKDLVPSADLALSGLLAQEAYPYEELSREDALKFLHKDAIVLKTPHKGFVVVRYCGLPLGFVKNLGNRSNNLHPQSRRIRMDINI